MVSSFRHLPKTEKRLANNKAQDKYGTALIRKGCRLWIGKLKKSVMFLINLIDKCSDHSVKELFCIILLCDRREEKTTWVH